MTRLTLVSAPTGYGKTTLVVNWLDSLAEKKIGIGWLSLDENDNDPVRFLSYLIAALQTAVIEIGETAAQLLQSPRPPAVETVLTLLINDVSHNDRPLILVLDDYHVITTMAIHQALAFLLDHLPPQLHLLLTTRSDPPLPLSRLRARSQVVEIRAHDLRFTVDETGRFFGRVMGLPLSKEETSALEERTEGWIAGLQMAALSLKDRTDRAELIATFTGSHAYVLDYLVDEVLRRQPEDVVYFLRETAVLGRFSAPLCLAVTGRADSDVLLRHLYQSNLFLEALDDRREWYRFHTLFRDVLRIQLQTNQPQNLPDLHRRAFTWFAQEGFVDEALEHALAAGELDPALAFLEHHAWLSLERGEYYTVRAWLDRFSEAHLCSQPGLALIYGFILAVTGQVNVAERLLQDTAAFWTAPDLPPWLRGELAQLQATLARFQGDVASCTTFAEEALFYLPPDRPASRAKALANLVLAEIVLGDNTAVEAHLEQLTELSKTTHKTTLLSSMQGVAAWFYTRRGHLAHAIQIYRQVLQEADGMKPRSYVAIGFAYAGLGEILYEQNDLDGAVYNLSQGIASLRNTIEQVAMARAAGILAQAHLAQGDFRELIVLDEAEAWLAQMRLDDMGFSRTLAVQRALINLKMGNLDTAVEWLATSDLSQGAEMGFEQQEDFLLMVRVYLAQGQPEKALSVLDGMQPVADSRQWPDLLIRIYCLRALALQAHGDSSAALGSLTQALILAEPEGYIRTFVDEGEPMLTLLGQAWRQSYFPHYIDKLLAAFSTTESKKIGGDLLPEPLSERELEVLRLIATGASNKDIADQLFIAVSTVKKHVGNILVKLDTPNRVQAIACARELGLLS